MSTWQRRAAASPAFRIPHNEMPSKMDTSMQRRVASHSRLARTLWRRHVLAPAPDARHPSLPIILFMNTTGSSPATTMARAGSAASSIISSLANW